MRIIFFNLASSQVVFDMYIYVYVYLLLWEIHDSNTEVSFLKQVQLFKKAEIKKAVDFWKSSKTSCMETIAMYCTSWRDDEGQLLQQRHEWGSLYIDKITEKYDKVL